MTCSSFMVQPPVRLAPSDTVAKAVPLLLSSGLPALPVVDDAGRLLGSFGLNQAVTILLPAAVRLGEDLGDLSYVHESLGDLADRLARHGADKVGDLMIHPTEVGLDCQGMEALLLLSRGEGFVAVVDQDHKLAGIITDASALSAVAGGK